MANDLKDFFGKNADVLKSKKLFLLDMDGTVYNENMVFAGTVDFLNSIKRMGARYVFITNNSSKSVEDYVKKVAKMGISASKEDFYTRQWQLRPF